MGQLKKQAEDLYWVQGLFELGHPMPLFSLFLLFLACFDSF